MKAAAISVGAEEALRSAVSAASPVWPNSPSPRAFLPIVVLASLALPWMHAATFGGLSDERSVRGLSALDWLAGRADDDGSAPLPRWLYAAALSLPFSDKSGAMPAPSCLFAAVAVVMCYRLGMRWFGRGVGVMSAALLACNGLLLSECAAARPSPIVLASVLAALVAFAEHMRRQEETISRWTIAGAAAVFALLLTAGWAAVLPPLFGLAAMAVRSEDRRERGRTPLARFLEDPTLRAGGLTLAIGGGAAAVWLLRAPWTAGPAFPWAEPPACRSPSMGFADLAAAMPATFVFAAYGLARSVRDFWRGFPGALESAAPMLWVALAAVWFPLLMPDPAGLLVLIAGANFFAARTAFDALDRRIRDRDALALLLASAAFWTLVRSETLSKILFHPTATHSDAEKLSAHWAVDAVVIWSAILVGAFRATMRNDRGRRMVLGASLAALMAAALGPAFVSLKSKSAAGDRWRSLREALEAHKSCDFAVVAGALERDEAAAPLMFLVRTVLPDAHSRTAADLHAAEAALERRGRSPILLLAAARNPAAALTIVREGGALTLARTFENERVAMYSRPQTAGKR